MTLTLIIIIIFWKWRIIEEIYFLKFLNKSPRSIEALRSLGYEANKLYEISFKEFLHINPELRVMDPEIQEKRYRHKEERKKLKIKEAIDRRKDMIENPEKIFKVKI